jgi:hypothetical protein
MKSNLTCSELVYLGSSNTGTGSIRSGSSFRLDAMPNTVMSSLRWLSRPQMLDGNPAYSYMVETPQGDFAVMIGHYVNGEIHPFEVWINGAEAPRGLGAIAKTLSADMRTYDRAWLSLKLESLALCDGYPCEVELPPDGDKVRVPGVVSAFARVVQYHVKKIGWIDGEGDNSLVSAMMFRKEPKTGTEGTLSKTFDVKNPSTGEDFAMFIKELELPDGTCRPYSVWLSGTYPKDLDGLCKLLSIDMRIVDLAWIGMKLRKLLNYKEPLGSFIGRTAWLGCTGEIPVDDCLHRATAAVSLLSAQSLEYGRVGESFRPPDEDSELSRDLAATMHSPSPSGEGFPERCGISVAES